MALNTKLSLAGRNAELNSTGLSPLLNNGYLRCYTGTQPADADSATTGTLLFEQRFASTAFGAAASGAVTAAAISNVVALASGTAGYVRCFQSDGTTVVMDGSAGVGATFNLNLSSTTITVGDTISGSALTLTMAASVQAAAVATQVVITTQPAGAVTAVAFTTQPVVEIRDALNVKVAGATNSVVASIASGTGVLSGTTTVAAVNGVATFTNLTITGPGATTLAFASTGLTGATSGSFTVGGASLTKIADWLDGVPATGTANSAISDGGNFDVVSGNAQSMNIVLGSSVSAPGGNAQEIRFRGPAFGSVVGWTNAVPASTTHYGRFYFRSDQTDQTSNHGIAYQVIPSIQIGPFRRTHTASGISPSWKAIFTTTGAAATTLDPYYQWRLGDGAGHFLALANSAWHRYEWQVEYLTATTYRLHPRIFLAGNNTSTPDYDENNYYNSNYETGNTRSLATHYNTFAGSYGFEVGVGVTNARSIGYGYDDPGGSVDVDQKFYIALPALDLTDWIGTRT